MRDVGHDPEEDHARNIDRALDDALALLKPYASLLLAVSGGPDSVALMLACARWAERGAHDIAIATVDHALRPESRAEAEDVGRWARALGFEHHLLTWEGEKPKTRLQERARLARYELLGDCARRVGAQAIVTAHHADDQAETILFRLTRGSGVAGLAGMSPLSTYGGLTLLRPLLGLAKADLEELCTRNNQPFFRDPSNTSERFARARLRILAPLLAAQGLDREGLLRLGARARQADAALAHYANTTLQRSILELEIGGLEDGLSLNANILRDAPREILQRTLALAILRLGPRASLRLERLERASAQIEKALNERTKLRLTLADVLIELRGERLLLGFAPPRKTKG